MNNSAVYYIYMRQKFNEILRHQQRNGPENYCVVLCKYSTECYMLDVHYIKYYVFVYGRPKNQLYVIYRGGVHTRLQRFSAECPNPSCTQQ